MLKRATLAAVMVWCATSLAVAQTQTAPISDADFMKIVAANNVAEIAYSDIADSAAKRSAVKAYADQVEAGHVATDRELKNLAEKKGVTLPTEMSTAQKTTRDELAKLKDEAFERAYLTQMIVSHKAAIADFTKASSSADADVKRFADRRVAVVRQLLTKAEELLKTVG